MAELSWPPIRKLQGRSNYVTWKFGMENYLIIEDLWDYVIGDNTDVTKDALTKLKITQMLEKHLHRGVKGFKTAKDMWEALENRYEDKDFVGEMKETNEDGKASEEMPNPLENQGIPIPVESEPSQAAVGEIKEINEDGKESETSAEPVTEMVKASEEPSVVETEKYLSENIEVLNEDVLSSNDDNPDNEVDGKINGNDTGLTGDIQRETDDFIDGDLIETDLILNNEETPMEESSVPKEVEPERDIENANETEYGYVPTDENRIEYIVDDDTFASSVADDKIAEAEKDTESVVAEHEVVKNEDDDEYRVNKATKIKRGRRTNMAVRGGRVRGRGRPAAVVTKKEAKTDENGKARLKKKKTIEETEDDLSMLLWKRLADIRNYLRGKVKKK